MQKRCCNKRDGKSGGHNARDRVTQKPNGRLGFRGDEMLPDDTVKERGWRRDAKHPAARDHLCKLESYKGDLEGFLLLRL